MTIEGFDAALPIENGGFVPSILPADPEPNGEPTLDQALRQSGRTESGGTMRRDISLDDDAWREATLDHLWFRHSRGAIEREDAIERQDTDGIQDVPLRKLNPGELALIAGGSGSDMNGEDGGPPVIVIGPYWDWIFPSNDPGDRYPSGGGGGGGQDPHQLTEDANDTPCVDQVPTAVDLNHLNDLAKYMGRVVAGLQESTGQEWGAFIYRTTNGQLYQSDPFTAGLHDSMDGAVGLVPSGAVIVGYLHTHPVDAAMDERNLSDDDQNFIRTLIQNGFADTNVLAYVVTKDNATSYKIYVYDKSKRTATSPGCDL